MGIATVARTRGYANDNFRSSCCKIIHEMLTINRYLITSGKLVLQPVPEDWSPTGIGQLGESWLDVQAPDPQELSGFLKVFDLHPHMLDHCLKPKNLPNTMTYGETLMLEYPSAFEQAGAGTDYLTFILNAPVLITIHPGPIPPLEELIHSLVVGSEHEVYHLPQIIYLILDHLADLNVQAEIDLREKILRTAQKLMQKPASVKAGDLTRLRYEVDHLVSLIENQLYCVSNLNAADTSALKEPHRKAYIQDLISEAEIAQRGVYRLESRLNDLYSYYQMIGSDLVERRLRVITILSAITLPLGLITGLLGMNVGGVPGITAQNGFFIVIFLMVVIGVAEYFYFKRNGWFD
jgi:magnesium transporter